MSTVEPLNQFDILAKLGRGDDLAPHEHAYLTAILLERELTKKQERPYYSEEFDEGPLAASGTCDATTGNLALPIFKMPRGWEGHLTNLTVDAPASSSITPTAPYANASSYAYIAVIPDGRESLAVAANSAAAVLRSYLRAFAPTSAAGPILPGQWTFNEATAPLIHENESVVYIIVGGSVSALQSLNVQVTARVNRYRRAVS